ncbi:NB-ARC domain-containing protein [Streptomyces sp. RFCAC02]|uniref:NB-ARC domain-containing protein n=1 Tax=Streptomyces sp. RFCAC02 TaxID=2499143 RepID=UPI001F100440|nr:NB-ARC domain-containing protein [Streptomyces sp. RFCAC02]
MAIHIPPQLSPFIDRDGERADALRAAEVSEAAGRPLCVAVSGLAGIGKTALAFELVRHAPRDRFPGGVTHLDLDDLRRDGVVEVADVLGDVMRQLGADPRGFEPGLAGRARQYQELTRTRRVAVVLDNARWDTEVVPLLPASGGSLLVVTSHGPLTGLPDGDVLSLDLGPLDDAHAAELLRSVVRDPRLDDADGVAAVVRLCAGLPAALHVAARALRDHRRRTLERLVPRLTVELDERGLPMVERVWDAAYASLAPDAALLYRLLADLPGGSSAAEAAVALLGRGAEAGDDALDDLRNAGLLTVAAEERFRLPDLLRAHARRRARADGAGADAERDAAVTRIVRWYLRQAREADRIAAGDRLTVGESVPELPGAPDVVFGAAAPDGASRAYAWLESERHALHACVRLAHARGMDGEVWSLCEPLWTHFLHNPHYADAVDAFRLGVLSAARAGNARALVRMRCQLARPLWEQDRLAEAEEELDHALAAARLLGTGRRTGNWPLPHWSSAAW